MSNPLEKGRFARPAITIIPAQCHIDYARLDMLLSRKEDLLWQIASIDKRLIFELAKLRSK